MLSLNKFKRFGGWRTDEEKKESKLLRKKMPFFPLILLFVLLFCISNPSQNNDFCVRPTGKHVLQVVPSEPLNQKPYNSSNEMDIFEINWHHFPFFSSSSFCVCVFAFCIRFHVNFHSLFTQCAVDGPLFRVSSLEKIFFFLFFSFSSV